MTSAPARALFLDRDGVINHDDGYTSRPEDFKFIDGIFDLCRAAKQSGYLLIVVTNQAGIGRGYYTEQDFFVLTAWMCARFEAEGAPITEVFFCPDHPEHGIGSYKKDSFDRKPNPGMLLRAAEKYGISLHDSIIVGDKDSDMQAAERAGVSTRCRYHMGTEVAGQMPCAETHQIHSFRDCIMLLQDQDGTY
ncbi:MAG: HAD family hydrolase [Halieaceae bacterium]|nr:HAD family hydrolase [Halieaceae bacterium]